MPAPIPVRERDLEFLFLYLLLLRDKLCFEFLSHVPLRHLSIFIRQEVRLHARIFADGGELTDWTFGLNWYATKNVRFMANYVIGDVEDEAEVAFGPDQDFNVIQFRAQLDF